jgi:hypothetical protein
MLVKPSIHGTLARRLNADLRREPSDAEMTTLT